MLLGSFLIFGLQFLALNLPLHIDGKARILRLIFAFYCLALQDHSALFNNLLPERKQTFGCGWDQTRVVHVGGNRVFRYATYSHFYDKI